MLTEGSELISAVMGASEPQTPRGPTIRLRFPKLRTDPEVLHSLQLAAEESGDHGPWTW